MDINHLLTGMILQVPLIQALVRHYEAHHDPLIRVGDIMTFGLFPFNFHVDKMYSASQ